MAFGTPNYGNDTIYYKNFKLKSPDTQKGESVYTLTDLRILPPLHSLEATGKWGVYHGQHFGYAGNSKEPGKPKQRPFSCIEKTDFRTKMVLVSCSACDKISENRAELDAREAEYKAKGKTESEIKDLLGPLTQWLKKHNCDRKWHINVMDRAGNFGVLQISHTLKKALDVKMTKLREEEKIDPIAANEGVWFRFSRMGKFPVTDSVEWVMNRSEDGSYRIERCPLTAAHGEQAEKICPDLATGVVKFLSANQINQIVACSGDPDEIDRIWALGTRTTERSPARTPAPAPVAAKPAPAAERPAGVDSEVERLKAEIARLTATKTEAAPVTSAPVAQGTVDTGMLRAPVVADEDGSDLDDEEFYQKFSAK